MKRLRMLLTAILTGALLLTGCTPKPPTGNDTPKTGQPAEKPRRPELTQPIESALLSLQAMNASGKNKDIPGAQEHFGQFRTHWAEVKAVLDKEDPKLAVHIEDGAVELDLEFAKPSDQFRFYELDEETVKLGRLLSKAADLLGAPIRAELVQ
ncbi:MAG TPA: hypothetical protein VD902_07980, partial [Symbiobacteriaceae bacterium]|nr:hypothetical protein [Symbiobacteriaceae bacterium]